MVRMFTRLTLKRTGGVQRPRDTSRQGVALREVAEVFRVDVVREAIVPLHWIPPESMDSSFSDDPRGFWDEENPQGVLLPQWDSSTVTDWSTWFYLVIFAPNPLGTAIGQLADSTGWPDWWFREGVLDGYQDLFSIAGLCELRRQFRNKPALHRWEVEVMFNNLQWAGVIQGVEASLRLLPFVLDEYACSAQYAIEKRALQEILGIEINH